MDETFNYKNDKAFRLLNMYERLNKGEVLYKRELADCYGVSEKTLQRDFNDLRNYLAETKTGEDVFVIYDKKTNGYYLSQMSREWFSNKEVLALCKILLESRAFNKEELNLLIDKLLLQITPNDRREVTEIIRKELFYYVPLKHGKNLLSRLWEITQYINNKEYIEISYVRKDGVYKIHQIKPVAILFSEYYFYVISYMADETKVDPTVFRIDRIQEINSMKKHFVTPYLNEFNDGEFRKRVQFMFTGKLTKVKFEYSGHSLEAILDRIPTAHIINERDGVYTLEAESYGEGIIMWLRTQGEYVKFIE